MKFQQQIFEARIYISFAIAAAVALLVFLILPPTRALAVIIGEIVGLSGSTAWVAGCLAAMMLLGAASLLRIWAGQVLTARRMMAFPVQTDAFVATGPYRLVRNPIYLADLTAMAAFALLLPPAGLLLPWLFAIHYRSLIHYEERNLEKVFRSDYAIYCWQVPRWLPTTQGLRLLVSRSFREELKCAGWLYNGLYLLFLPGLALTLFTHQLWQGLLIGLPAVIAWAVVHTRIGVNAYGVRQRSPKPPKVLRDILYAQCWEDPQIDRQAFDIGADDVVFCITSGGCNAMAFLLDNPKKLIALDLNPFQTHLLDLKLAAFARLDYGEMLELMGVRESTRRDDLYRKLRPALRPDSQLYWDRQQDKIEKGTIHCGRFEAYLRLLRKCIRLLVGRKAIQALYHARTPLERLHVFRHRWCTVRWLLFTRVLLSRRVMSLLFDEAFFKYLDASFSFGRHFEKKIQRALTRLPLHENWFLCYMLLGHYYDEHNLPPYLRRENYKLIRSRVGRIELATGDCASYFAGLPGDSISRFNFTNIFEWMSPVEFESLLRETVRVASPGAVLTYRNLLVKRQHPNSLEYCIHGQRAFAEWLHARDLSFIYDHYVVERVYKELVSCPVTSELCATAL